jgi:cysteinyl-tRNA synthetase
MPLFIHDTLRRRKVEFTPADPKRITMYVCGPTVYNYAHIGNARPAVVFDVLYRLLKRLYPDAEVIYARNITDVDDKINAAAIEQGVPIGTITDKFAKIFNDDMAALGALAPTIQPRATAHIPAMADQIKRLIDVGAAYVAEGHVLFRISSFPDYGRLSGRTLDDMIAGARVEVAPYKEHPGDFVLWKPSKPGEPEWDAGGNHFPPGRPGWHIECSAMIESELGLPIDIHGGGHDLIFPHHENEIAQGVMAQKHLGATDGGEYARYWMHNGFLDMSGEKMSKSLGNVVLVHDLLKQYPGEVIRWALLSGHYRSPLDWTPELLERSKTELDKIYGTLRDAKKIIDNSDYDPEIPYPGEISERSDRFEMILSDDLNTPQARAHLFGMRDRLQAQMGSKPVDTQARRAQNIRRLIVECGSMLGVLQQDPDAWFEGGASDDLKAKVEALIAERIAARAAKDFAAADRIRDQLTALNVVVMDGPTGATWRMKD